MYARLTTVLAPDQPGETAEVFEQILPTLRELNGFKGIVVASEEDGKRVVALTLWESAEALEASTPVLDGLRDAEIAGRNVEGRESAAFRAVGLDVRPLAT